MADGCLYMFAGMWFLLASVWIVEGRVLWFSRDGDGDDSGGAGCGGVAEKGRICELIFIIVLRFHCVIAFPPFYGGECFLKIGTKFVKAGLYLYSFPCFHEG